LDGLNAGRDLYIVEREGGLLLELRGIGDEELLRLMVEFDARVLLQHLKQHPAAKEGIRVRTAPRLTFRIDERTVCCRSARGSGSC
jgi:hypothetical protein